jgi:transitional endoplasmic reticulum ATPase
MEKELKLKVVEALQDDAYKGIARIDTETMRKLELKRGDVIVIKGGKETVAIVDRAYPADLGQQIIRIDGIIRKNAKTGIGEVVKISKAEVKEAKKVTIAPTQKGIMIQGDPEMFKRGLLGRAVVKGDIIVMSGRRRESPDFDDVFNDFFADAFRDFGIRGFVNTQMRFMIVSATPSQPVVITENTELILSPKAVEISEEKMPTVTYEDIGGLGEELRKIREMVEIPLKHPEIFEKLGIEPPKGVLLYGPPGTGKTMLAKAVANETEANFILINGPECMSKFYGESEKNLRDKFEEAEKNAPTIIFIDEIDAIAPKREESYGEVERRVVSQLLTSMDGLKSRGKVVVIGATNRPNAIDPALRRPGRFDREIVINVPDKNGRLSILKIHSRNMPLAKDVNLDDLAALTHGFVGADLASLCKEAAMAVLRKALPKIKLEDSEEIPREVLESLRVTKQDFQEALKNVRPSAMREVLVETPNIKWEDVGGLDKVKDELKEAVEWPLKFPENFTRMGIKPPKGVLLYGPPGTGKTLLAKAVAKESEANFIQIKGPSLLSMWVGKSEEGVRKIFERARQVSPCIIFFDEIDSLASRRGLEAGTRVTDQVLNQLLAEMDGLEELQNVTVVGATNRPDMLDPAILRPGRFDKILLVSPPTKEGRLQIFQIHTSKMPISISKEEVSDLDKMFKDEKVNIASKMAGDESVKDSDLKNVKDKFSDIKKLDDRDKLLFYLADRTEGYVGADIEGVCREAALIALRKDRNAKEVGKEDFEDALRKIKASVSLDSMEKYRKIEQDYLRSARAALEKPICYLG